MWTRFVDLGSGGGQKLEWGWIYIEAPEEEAKVIFYNRFDRDPTNVTCPCCGKDYSIRENESLEQLTYYDRLRSIFDESKGRVDLEEFLENKRVLFIFDKDIRPEERLGKLPWASE